MYVEHIVEVFRAVRRVLRKDGLLWINCGDSYSHKGVCGGESPLGPTPTRAALRDGQKKATRDFPVPEKNLIGQPWRIAFALQADGWILRSDIIWIKDNPMPEPGQIYRRPTKSHEHIFLFAKSKRNFWDAEAVREMSITPWHGVGGWRGGRIDNDWGPKETRNDQREASGRHMRDVWYFPTESVKEAHFATFPRRLPELCIKASTSERGCCSKCGAPWERMVERTGGRGHDWNANNRKGGNRLQIGQSASDSCPPGITVKTTGWAPTCKCEWYQPKPDCPEPVLDMVRERATMSRWRGGLVNNVAFASSGTAEGKAT